MAQQAQQPETQWFLRTSGDTVFGPVTPEGLVVWAEQGRVLPGHDVSTDRKKWIPAVSLDFLNMTWYVDEGEGDLRGPLHRAAAEALLKSGKVSEEARLVSAEDVDKAETPSDKAKPVNDQPSTAAQKALTQRIQELELQLNERVSHAKAETTTLTLGQLSRERDALTSRITELETLCDSLKRNAEKDLRAGDKKMESLRGENKRLEGALEDLRAQLQSVPAPAFQPTEVPDETIVRDLRDKLSDSEQKNAALSEHLSRVQQEALNWRDEHALSEQKRQESRSLADAVEQQYSDMRTRMEQMKKDFDRLNSAQEKSAEEIRKALARASEADRDFADLLAMANTRDTEYLEKIAELQRFSSQSPDKIAQFYADQAAVYQLFQKELEALSKEQEAERDHLEGLKQLSLKRMDAIQERKQSLTRQLGSSPADMTRLGVREQPSDPAAARIRSEFDKLRFTHERDMRASEERERDLLRKVHIHETEAARLKSFALDGERSGKQLQELNELLRRREHELAEERKARDSERAQFLSDQQALVTRLEVLERDGRPEQPSPPTAEVPPVKRPLWSRVK